jgi:gamma-glutamyl phosphate reductase
MNGMAVASAGAVACAIDVNADLRSAWQLPINAKISRETYITTMQRLIFNIANGEVCR